MRLTTMLAGVLELISLASAAPPAQAPPELPRAAVCVGPACVARPAVPQQVTYTETYQLVGGKLYRVWTPASPVQPATFSVTPTNNLGQSNCPNGQCPLPATRRR